MKQVWQAKDGRTFDSKERCEAYEKRNQHKTYRVLVKRLYVNQMVVEITARDMPTARKLIESGQGKVVCTYDQELQEMPGYIIAGNLEEMGDSDT